MSIIRDLTLEVKKYLLKDESLLIVGARQAGKTTFLHQLEEIIKRERKSSYFLNLEDPDYLALLNQSPKNLFKIFPLDLKETTFIFLDEIQYLDNPSSFLKFFYDQYKGKLKIIASGSSAFWLDKKFKDSLVGRKRIFYLYTLSFREFLRFKNEPLLAKKDFDNLTLSEKEKVLPYYYEYLTFGGYPRVVLASLEEKKEVLQDLVYSYIKKDVLEANIRQEEIFYKLFKILASQVGQLVNTSELANTLGISKTAIENYLYIMQKSFYLTLIRPFFRNLRKEIIKMPKIYFLDLGLRNFLVNDFRSFKERIDKGQILENACFRQLIEKYSLEEIKFWRTTQKQEVDFIIEEEAFEVKVNPASFKKGKYKPFLTSYPKIDLNIVSLETSLRKVGVFPVLEVWKL